MVTSRKDPNDVAEAVLKRQKLRRVDHRRPRATTCICFHANSGLKMARSLTIKLRAARLKFEESQEDQPRRPIPYGAMLSASTCQRSLFSGRTASNNKSQPCGGYIPPLDLHNHERPKNNLLPLQHTKGLPIKPLQQHFKTHYGPNVFLLPHPYVDEEASLNDVTAI
ncbi:hypothetical protein S40288_11537 [Stachybotrys chartarum IBT 40288]|nr:hypothetical protein S40288_11537 [Stachybotrys chartarum IBT 40288]